MRKIFPRKMAKIRKKKEKVSGKKKKMKNGLGRKKGWRGESEPG